MALAYRVPGVTVTEVVSPSVSPLLATPASVCLVGLTAGLQSKTEQLRLVGTTPVTLERITADSTLDAVVSVKDAFDPTQGAADGSGYTVTSDYTISTSNHTITRVGGGAIPDGTVVNVTYTYTEPRYFDAVRLTDYPSVESRFGPALDASGNILTPVTFASLLAFENGASELVIQPLFKRSTPGDTTTAKVQPDVADIPSVTTWQDTYISLRDIEDINVLVPIVGQSDAGVGDNTALSLLQAAQDHVKFMRDNQQYLVSIFGEDSSADATVATRPTLRSHGETLKSRYGGITAQQTVLLSPSKFSRPRPTLTNTPLYFGGQYEAAAIAGMLAARPTWQPLTGEVVSGTLAVEASSLKSEKDADAAAGLLVLEQRGASLIQVRHSITLDNANSAVRELSVVRGKHRMIESIRDTLRTQIIGKIIADSNSPFIVRSAVGGVLEQLRQDRTIDSYKGLAAAISSLEPTEILVRFDYRPSFPLNYVTVQFSVDVNSGDLTLNTVSQ